MANTKTMTVLNKTIAAASAPKETIEDYVRWRSDLSLSRSPFNVFDAMVLSQLAYVDFSKILTQDDPLGMTLFALGESIGRNGIYKLCNLYGGHEDFFENVCRSKRYRHIMARNYRDIFDESTNAQFGAVEFSLNEKVSFIAYRGTDNSIIGWKEDFMISFTRIKSQEYAKQYLLDVFQPDKKYYVGGHSKGGNLAMYACAWLSAQQRGQLLRIYDFDGPGFCKDTFDHNKLNPLLPLTTKVIPEFCMIGKVFEIEVPDTTIVKSKDFGVDQHDIISWLTNGMNLQTVETNDRISEWMDSSIMSWVNDATFEERKRFVDEFFGALQAGGAQTMQEVTGKGMLEVVKAMANASPESKKLVVDLASIAVLGDHKNKE